MKSSKGFTLIEIMVGMLILSFAFTTLATVLTSISKSVLVNRGKTIATNLAQEKVEALKNLTYYRLVVTTWTNIDAGAQDTNFPALVYDVGTTLSYYPEEVLNVGEMSFKRRVYVEFLKLDGDNFVGQPWTANDTGIKRITVYVVWKEQDEWKKVEIRNLRNNPDRAEMDFSFTGVVSSDTAGYPPLYNVLVETVENPSYFARTDINGEYSFKVAPGTYTLRATATGYFTSISTNYIVTSGVTGSSNHNFRLSRMATGNATGYVYLRDHLVITQVVASTGYPSYVDNNAWEWVELYNPTTYNILIASRCGTCADFNVFFVTVSYICNLNHDPQDGVDQSGSHPSTPKEFAYNLIGNNPSAGSNNGLTVNFRSTSPHWTANTSTISIPPNTFFLIANVSTINAVNGINVNRIADAYYTRGGGDINNVIAANSAVYRAGGIRVNGGGGYTFNGRSDWHDGVGWNGGSDSAPSYATEESGINTCTGGTCYGIYSAYVFYRVAFRVNSGDASQYYFTTTRRNSFPFSANNFDNNKNGESYIYNGASVPEEWVTSWIPSFVTASSAVFNSDVTMTPYSGTPAYGASVAINDGLSAASYVQSYGSFTVTSVATGTWTVRIASGNYYREISTVTMTTNLSTGVPNNSTIPTQEFTGFPTIALTSTTTYGYISGTVKSGTGAGLSAVSVSVTGADTVQTDSTGKFTLSIEPSGGSITLTFSKTGYSNEVVSVTGVTVGQTTTISDVTLVTAGYITGFVTTNGAASGALPGVPVVVTDLTTTTIMGSAITGVNGKFVIQNVDTGTYNVSLQLESGESATPSLVRVGVTTVSSGTWSSTFTVTNAFGKITGVVGTTSSTSPITTGILLVASTFTIKSQDPPELNSTLRSGSSVYYAVSSDAVGSYSLNLRGNASYYLYGWRTESLGISVSSSSKRQAVFTHPTCPNCHWVPPGGTITRDISW